MAFHLFTGNDLSVMAARLAERLRMFPPEDTLAQSVVVIQSAGTARWLGLELAAYNDISANMDFVFPGKFVYQYLFHPMSLLDADIVLPEMSGHEIPFTPEVTPWIIADILAESADNSLYGEVCRYIQNDPLKRWQIAVRIARVYDRYMTYRPNILHRWETFITDDFGGWQADLWRRLLVQAGIGLRHFSGLYQRFSEHVTNGTAGPILQPLKRRGHLSVFGFSALPPVHLAMLYAASREIEVDFYWFNPCAAYWGDAPSRKDIFQELELLMLESDTVSEIQNPLLGALGRRGREFFNLMMQLTADGSGEIGDDGAFRTDIPDTLLGRVQSDIQDNSFSAGSVDLSADGSVEIHNCFSPLRETEVLYDYILSCFACNPALLPKDIVVYTPDIETYAPYIDAVFGAPENPAFRIPFTIADRKISSEFPEFRYFLSLLSLMRSRFTASDLFGLLSLSSIRLKFKISEQDIDVLGKLMKEANAAWGIDDLFRERVCGVGFYENSWRFALERAFLGMTLHIGDDEDSVVSFGGRRAVPLTAAAEHVHLVGAFAEFCDAVFGLCGQVRSVMDGAGWVTVLSQLLDTFFESDSDSSAGLMSIRENIALLSSQLAQTGQMTRPIVFEVIESWMKAHAEGAVSDEKFCRGMVTFCRFQPMRSIPAKVVCMLGMNDNVFPRRDQFLAFDMMVKTRYIGDGSLRDDDRFAFLEAILSAREKVALFYTGQSDKDKKNLPPSVLVSELCDALERMSPGIVRTLRAAHPLLPFSELYFQEDRNPLLRNFSQTWFYVANGIGKVREKENATVDPTAVCVPETLSLTRLIQFLKSPCRIFYKQTVGVDLDMYASDRPDDIEPELLNDLEKYSIRKTILENALQGRLAADVYDRLKCAGTLPPGPAGEMLFQQLTDDISGVTDRVCGIERIPSVSGLLHIGGLTFEVNLNQLCRESQMIVFPGSWKPQRALEAFVYHAAMTLLRSQNTFLPATTILIAKDTSKKKYKEFLYPSMTEEDAFLYLESLVQSYLEGLMSPLCFDPGLSWAYRSAVHSGKVNPYLETVKLWEADGKYAERPDKSFTTAFGCEAWPEQDPRWRDFITYADRILTLPVIFQTEVISSGKKGT